MKRSQWLVWSVVVAMLALLVPSGMAVQAAALQQPPPPSANVSVYATGLDNPRGLKFGPDGNLYVAEGGQGGSDSTVGMCTQVIAPVGPYTGSPTDARISMIAADGTRTTAVDNLPSSQTSPALGGEVSGVGDIAFIGDTLYAVLAGAGCSHGVSNVPNGVIRANSDGTWDMVADLSAFQMDSPVMRPEEEDFEPDGGWYSLLASGNDLYAIEPNHGELDKIGEDGTVERVVDISASQGHVVPTALVMGPDGDFYVGNLDEFPVTAGESHIYKITPDGVISVYASGLTAVLGLAFGGDGQLYALETSAAVPMPEDGSMPELPVVPGSGRVVAVMPNGDLREVATGLMLPTAMTMGPDGMLYVSNCGFGCPAGAGEIVRIDIPQRAGTFPGGIAYELVASMTMPTPQSAIGYGFLSEIGGFSDDVVFSSQPYDENTAVFTFYTEARPVKQIKHGDLQAIDLKGTTTVYYNPNHGDFANPDSFKAGTPVVTTDFTEHVVMDTTAGTLNAVDLYTVTDATPFAMGDGWAQLAQPGDQFRAVLSGHANALDDYAVEGYGMAIGSMQGYGMPMGAMMP